MTQWLVVGLGGFFGALARYWLSGFAQRISGASFPVGTLSVNVLGSFAIGVLMCWIEQRESWSEQLRLFLIIGLLGSLTTFSTVAFETFHYLRSGDYRSALLNAVANLAIGLLAVATGWWLCRRFA